MAGSGPHAGELVGGNAHADSGSADQNRAIDFTGRDFLAGDRSNVGIINALGAEAADILHLMPQSDHKLDELGFHSKTTMIAADGHSHVRSPWISVRALTSLTAVSGER